jgi:hypothetical protein
LVRAIVTGLTLTSGSATEPVKNYPKSNIKACQGLICQLSVEDLFSFPISVRDRVAVPGFETGFVRLGCADKGD